MADRIAEAAPTLNDKADYFGTTKTAPTGVFDRLEAQFEIAAGTMIAGLTNVVTLQFDELSRTTYPGIGSMHAGIGHGQVKNMIESRRAICGLHFTQIARIAAALQSVPEGNGSMLDNTLMIYLSDNGESHHSSGVNYGLLLLGDLGGRLKRRRYFSPGQ
ncbi:MAG: hypothetical protein HC812_10220 [Leptolyngbya sp. RL_3_1]|nr:hypothetical protein [Leptolyngbya sp. RL_3_1]